MVLVWGHGFLGKSTKIRGEREVGGCWVNNVGSQTKEYLGNRYWKEWRGVLSTD